MPQPPRPNLAVNPLVGNVWAQLQAAGGPAGREPPRAAGFGDTVDRPDLVVFVGFLGDQATSPAGDAYRFLYLDWSLTSWLLVEESGIVHREQIQDSTTRPIQRDAIWVAEDAAVGQGNGSQSIESQFLTGRFTRAGDFDAPLGGGTHDSAAGVFYRAHTPLCCYKLSRK